MKKVPILRSVLNWWSPATYDSPGVSYDLISGIMETDDGIILTLCYEIQFVFKMSSVTYGRCLLAKMEYTCKSFFFTAYHQKSFAYCIR